MARLKWDLDGRREYRYGVDHGVLFYGNTPHVWNGLTQVTLNQSSTPTAQYQDGVIEDFYSEFPVLSANVTAYTYPDILDDAAGEQELLSGLRFDEQRVRRLNFTFRTTNGTDLDGTSGYSIHLFYDAIFVPNNLTASTKNAIATPDSFGWSLYPRPRDTPAGRPTGHVVIDSTTTPAATMTRFEDYLYGTSAINGRFPSIDTLVDLWGGYNDLIVIDYGDGTYSVEGRAAAYRSTDVFTINHERVTDVTTSSFAVNY